MLVGGTVGLVRVDRQDDRPTMVQLLQALQKWPAGQGSEVRRMGLRLPLLD